MSGVGRTGSDDHTPSAASSGRKKWSEVRKSPGAYSDDGEPVVSQEASASGRPPQVPAVTDTGNPEAAGHPSSAAKDRDPRLPETSAVGSLPDTQEGRGEGPGTSAASPRGLTIDCGEGKHDVCCGFGTSSYLIPQTAGERFECACPCHEQPAAYPYDGGLDAHVDAGRGEGGGLHGLRGASANGDVSSPDLSEGLLRDVPGRVGAARGEASEVADSGSAAFSGLDAQDVTYADELPAPDEVLLAAHDKPSYPSDPGTGFEVLRAGNRIFLSLFWDGDVRGVWELTERG